MSGLRALAFGLGADLCERCVAFAGLRTRRWVGVQVTRDRGSEPGLGLDAPCAGEVRLEPQDEDDVASVVAAIERLQACGATVVLCAAQAPP